MKSMVVTIGEDIEVSAFVSKFNDDNGLTGGAPLTVKDFLDFTGSSNLTNRQKIVKTYTPEEQLKWMSGADPTMIKAGIFVRVPLNKTMVEKQLIYGKNQYLKQDNFNAYFNEYQKILQSSDGYYKLESLISHIDRVSIDAQVVNLNVRVWIYSKVLDELIDVSPLVVACNTSKNMAMGAFSITLNPAKSLEFDVEYPTAVNQKGSVNTFNFTGNRDELIADYFEKYIQYNDLVFIRFERLQVEKDDVGYESGQVLKLSTLANPIADPDENPSWYRVWDMMGLVDSVDVGVNNTVVVFSFSTSITVASICLKDFTETFPFTTSILSPFVLSSIPDPSSPLTTTFNFRGPIPSTFTSKVWSLSDACIRNDPLSS